MSLSLSPRAAAIGALFAATCPCLAQDELALAVDKLASEASRDHAIEELVSSGEACVRLLIPLLERSGEADEPQAEQLIAALAVLERLGAGARLAADAVTDAFRSASDLRVRNAALATLGELTPGLSETVCAGAVQVLRRNYTTSLDPGLFTIAMMRLNLGPKPDEPLLRDYLESGSRYAIAAARALHDLDRLPDDLREELRRQLTRALRRPSLPWLVDADHVAATGDLARALHRHGEPAQAIARGLLFCRQANLRRLGLEHLHDIASWTLAERFDLARMLWDPDRATQELAVATVTSLDAAGLIALRPLRAFESWEASQGSGRRANYFGACAGRLIGGAAGRSEIADELVSRIDLVLRSRSAPLAGEPLRCDEAGRELLAAIVRGCAGVDDATPLRLARLAVTAGATPLRDGDDPLRDAFLSLLDVGDEQCWYEAARALAELGPAAAPAPRHDLGSLLLESRWRFPQRAWESTWTAEAAILAGPAATTEQLTEALSSDRWHIAMRAAVELLGRSEVTATHRDRLIAMLEAGQQRMTTEARFDVLQVTGRYVAQRSHDSDVDATRAIVAMALASIGDASWRGEAHRQTLADQLGWPVAELERRIDDARVRGELGKLAHQIELKAWNRTGWPRFP